MTEARPPVPQPVPADTIPVEIPEHLKPLPPGPLRVTQVVDQDEPELAVIFKKTYEFRRGAVCWPADEQVPLVEDGETYEPPEPEAPASLKALPEVVGLRSGTDLIVQGSARPRAPVTTMEVAVRVGDYRHRAQVFGRRVCDSSGGRISFSSPEPFDEIPLRYENAYGGLDHRFQAELVEEVKRTTPREDLRRVGAFAKEILGANSPLAYPRNRFGKGYVLEDRPELTEGRELPNLERPDDLLAPERLVVGGPLEWLKQPLPVGFDFLDPLSFPRSAMLGMPQASSEDVSSAPEVAHGLVPPDFCRGNVFAARPEQVPDVVHPWASRCASLGLQLGYLRGDEAILLEGMDPDEPELWFRLPGEHAVFSLSQEFKPWREIQGVLHQVLVSVPERRVCLIWVGRAPMAKALVPGEARGLGEDVPVRMREIGR